MKVIRCLLLWCAFWTVLPASAQTVEKVTGIIYENQKGTSLIGANVILLNANNRMISGVTTNIDGKFEIKVLPGMAKKIQFSFIGMKSVTEDFVAGKKYEIVLKDDNVGLDEVVVTGKAKPKADFGMLQKDPRDMGNAVSKVDMKVLSTQSVSSVDQMLQGAVPGLQVTFNSGDPGAGASIRIRGVSSLTGQSNPLWIIDGTEVIGDDYNVESITNFGFNPIGDIDPSEVEDINVLKDAAATALYGSRGANGVIVIKTKRGVKGKPTFSFSTKLTGTLVPKKVPMLNGDQMRMFLIESRANKNGGVDNESQYQELRGDLNRADAWIFNNNYDLVDMISRTGFQQNYNLSLRGGGERLNYYWSLGYEKEMGTTIGGGYERFTTMVNLDYRMSDKLKISSKFSYANSLTDKRSSQWPGHLKKNGTDILNPLGFARTRAPFLAVYNQKEDEYYITNSAAKEAYGWGQMYNPLAMIDYATFQTRNNRFTASLSIDFQISKGLSLFSQVSTDYRQSGDEFFCPAGAIGDAANSIAYNSGMRADGYEMKLVNNNRITWVPLNTEKHWLQFTAVADLIYSQNNSLKISYVKSGSPHLQDSGGKGQIGDKVEGSETLGTTVSLVVDAHYRFLNRYNINFALKTEGSSVYGKDNPYSLFPTAAFAWRLKEESFLKEVEWVDELKPRVSFGRSGKLPAINNLLSVTYASGSNGYLGDAYSNIDKFAYDNLHEERTTQWNYGLDYSFFNTRLSGEFNYYRSTTDDLLMEENIATSTGFASRWSNFGSLRNEGWEFGIKGVPVDIEGKFRWSLFFNIAQNENKMLTLPEQYRTEGFKESLSYDFQTITFEGTTLGAVFGYKAKGVYSRDEDAMMRDLNGNPVYDENGHPKKMRWGSSTGEVFEGGDMAYEDVNHDGVINKLDIVQIGDANPKCFGMLRNDFNYKNWQLGFSLYYSIGQDVINGMRRETECMDKGLNQAISIEQRWKKQGDVTDMPRGVEGITRNYAASSRWVEDASYLKLKDISLTYNFDRKLLQRTFIKMMSVWVSGMNLLTWSKYKGVDPEVGFNEGKAKTISMDSQNTAPPIRFTFGFRANF
ncbi:MAG: SusC/RagA family TonB-linked outer membrane protein [Odoribacter sp.]